MLDENLLFFFFLITEIEEEAWLAFRNVVNKFLAKKKVPDYVVIVENTQEKLKTSFIACAFGFFPQNLGIVCEKQGHFHQDVKEVEREDIKAVVGMLLSWATIDGCYTVKNQKHRTREKATRAASVPQE